MSVVLRADSIGKAFGARAVLISAYLEARGGELTALVGRNGAGKSTLLKIAAGWTRADHGFVEIAGVRHHRPAAAVLARAGVFLLSSDRSILSPRFTPREHADAVEARFGAGGRAAIFGRLGLASFDTVPCGRLSGGERRRAEVAVALLRRPTCLLADEPFRGLDPQDAEILRDVLCGVAAEGCAVVFTGHETGWMLDLAGRVVWLHDGTTELVGSGRDAAASWRFRRGYLGACD